MIKPIPFGKYILLDKLATGGMAEIFVAMARGLGGFEKILVIKRILPHHSSNKEFLSMFFDEARILVQLNNSNIVQVYDFGEVNGHYYLALEYVEGKNLREILARVQELGEKIPLEHSLFLTSEIAKGLDYAHRKKDEKTHSPLSIVHRDVSPQNILVSYEGEAKLIDFGIAQAVHVKEDTESGVLKGKFGYMSPEQARGDRVDYHSDIFSCGIVLYELLTCQRLFSGETDLEILEKIKKCHVPMPSLYNSDIPEEVENIVFCALHSDREKRFDKALDLQKALVHYLSKINPGYTSYDLGSYVKKIFAHDVLEQKKRMKDIISLIQEIGGDDLIRIQKPPHSVETYLEGEKKSLNTVQDAVVNEFGKKLEILDTYVGKKPVQEEILSYDIEELREKSKKTIPSLGLKSLTYMMVLAVTVGFLFSSMWYLFTLSPQRHVASVKFSITLTSDPTGAHIFINEKDISHVTPYEIQNLKIQDKIIVTLKKEDYKEKTIPLSRDEIKSGHVVIKLEPIL